MCGICGVASRDSSPVQKPLLEKMNAAIIHRGPDGEGFYSAAGVGLAMRRLAVIDLNTGDQPISNEDETVWIVFNGEIYNFPDLRVDLVKRGHLFRTRTDTECVVHLYEEYGVACIQYLRGMFAFALWDVKKQTLFIARDRLGKKPLYYTVQGNSLYFASELSGVFAALPQRPPVDMQAIDLYLSLQYIPEPLTAYKGIFKLLPAHFLLWHRGDLHTERYWQLNYLPKHTGSEEELTEELSQRVKEAVRIRLISDVPLGAHLSGGIDSSVVVASIAEASSGPVKTFTINFDEAEFSEVSYARSVAQRYSTDHHEFTLTFDNIPGAIETIMAHIGEPFADPSALPSFYLSKLTRQYVTVALNGDGGDEAFAGYPRYWLDPWANRYLRLPAYLTRRLIPSLTDLLPERADRPVGRNLAGGLKRLGQVADTDPRASLLRWGSYFPPALKQRLWKESYRTLNLHRAEMDLAAAFDSAPAHSFLDRTLYTDITSYLPGDLLVKADRMAMANSLEGRSPFLDHKLMEWAARLPENLRVRGGKGKYLLRKAFKDDLPEKVQRRGKQGFGVPVGAWLRGPLSAWAEQLIRDQLTVWFEPVVLGQLFEEHRSGRVNHGKRLWALTALAIWKNSLVK
jgi:asparagine synthase (glutamine-hydrolysing)